jgi:hypothetical protein
MQHFLFPVHSLSSRHSKNAGSMGEHTKAGSNVLTGQLPAFTIPVIGIPTKFISQRLIF